MEIRHANMEDLQSILEIYDYARMFMKENGNPRQWGDGYPAPLILKNDIRQKQLFVGTDKSQIYGVFAFILGEDPTYSHIEHGSWKSNDPYGTIHRIAGNGRRRGFMRECVNFCRSRADSLRADTHEDNLIMQHLLEKNGFERCGIIRVRDGSPRIAYQYVH